MRNIILKLFQKVGIESRRTKDIVKHISWSFLFKFGSIIANFMLVPLTIDYLNVENYGIWLTLSSFISWFTFFDVGLGNGLRNKFAAANAEGDLESAKGYVSTAYYSLGVICLGLVCTTGFGSLFINWTTVFNTSADLQNQLQLLMPIVFGCLCLQLITKLISTIYTADQKPSIEAKISFITSICSLFLIWILIQTTKSSLLIFGALFSLLPILVLLILNFYAFSTRYKKLKPSKLYFKKIYFKEIFGLGLTFFIIQISAIILFSTDSFIITQLFGPDEVVPYSIAQKYLSLPLMAFNMILLPYWSSITVAYTEGDFGWIKQAISNLSKFSFGGIVLIILLIIIAPFFYKFWIGGLVLVPLNLTLSMALFFMINIFYSPYTAFINGIGKIQVQMFTLLGAAILNIPLSILLVKCTFLGVEGVIIATIICVLPHAIICPLQYLKLINNRANGLWNK